MEDLSPELEHGGLLKETASEALPLERVAELLEKIDVASKLNPSPDARTKNVNIVTIHGDELAALGLATRDVAALSTESNAEAFARLVKSPENISSAIDKLPRHPSLTGHEENLLTKLRDAINGGEYSTVSDILTSAEGVELFTFLYEKDPLFQAQIADPLTPYFDFVRSEISLTSQECQQMQLVERLEAKKLEKLLNVFSSDLTVHSTSQNLEISVLPNGTIQKIGQKITPESGEECLSVSCSTQHGMISLSLIGPKKGLPERGLTQLKTIIEKYNGMQKPLF